MFFVGRPCKPMRALRRSAAPVRIPTFKIATKNVVEQGSYAGSFRRRLILDPEIDPRQLRLEKVHNVGEKVLAHPR